jgi:hypothetical protein
VRRPRAGHGRFAGRSTTNRHVLLASACWSQRHREVARRQSPLKSGRRRLKHERQVARRFVTTARGLQLGLPFSEPNASVRSQRVTLPGARRRDGRSRRPRTRSFATRFRLRPRAATPTALPAAPGPVATVGARTRRCGTVKMTARCWRVACAVSGIVRHAAELSENVGAPALLVLRPNVREITGFLRHSRLGTCSLAGRPTQERSQPARCERGAGRSPVHPPLRHGRGVGRAASKADVLCPRLRRPMLYPGPARGLRLGRPTLHARGRWNVHQPGNRNPGTSQKGVAGTVGSRFPPWLSTLSQGARFPLDRASVNWRRFPRFLLHRAGCRVYCQELVAPSLADPSPPANNHRTCLCRPLRGFLMRHIVAGLLLLASVACTTNRDELDRFSLAYRDVMDAAAEADRCARMVAKGDEYSASYWAGLSASIDTATAPASPVAGARHGTPPLLHRSSGGREDHA